MNLEDEIKKEIYDYVLKYNLTESELKEIDTYVLSLLNSFKTILEAQKICLDDKEKLHRFKKIILENIGETKIV